jgi:hypothetical protein
MGVLYYSDCLPCRPQHWLWPLFLLKSVLFRLWGVFKYCWFLVFQSWAEDLANARFLSQRLSVLGWLEAGCYFVKWFLDCVNPEGIRETIRIRKHSCNLKYENGYKLRWAWFYLLAPSQPNLGLNQLRAAVTELSFFSSLWGGMRRGK